MPAISGVGGQVTFAGGYVTNAFRWNVDYVADVLESTDFTVTADRTFIPNLRSWSGSYECYWDDTVNLVDPGAAAAVATFQLNAGQTLTGEIIVTGVRPAVQVDDIARVTIDFQGTGLLTIT